jgi:uncharacterized membrane protein
MNDVAIARALHVVGVVIWIGGMSLITTVLLPLVRRSLPTERWALFDALERRFAWQARAAILIVGASGFYMLFALGLWDRFRQPGFWWMHAMLIVWLIFAFVLFIAEPLWGERFVRRRECKRPGSGFALLQMLHWVLLAVSGVTVLGAVLGSYGTSWFP